jgi:hypothetical protein
MWVYSRGGPTSWTARIIIVIDEFAPRRGAGKLARGTRFVRTPGVQECKGGPHAEGVRGIPDTLSGCGFWVSNVFQGYAQNAYPC